LWPESEASAKPLEAYEAQLLIAAADVSRVRAAPMWHRVNALKEKTSLPLCVPEKVGAY
jgi:hypothetical protein